MFCKDEYLASLLFIYIYIIKIDWPDSIYLFREWVLSSSFQFFLLLYDIAFPFSPKSVPKLFRIEPSRKDDKLIGNELDLTIFSD